MRFPAAVAALADAHSAANFLLVYWSTAGTVWPLTTHGVYDAPALDAPADADADGTPVSPVVNAVKICSTTLALSTAVSTAPVVVNEFANTTTLPSAANT